MLSSICQIIKLIAAEANDAHAPADIVLGTAISVNPLKIQIDQKIILEEEFITVPEKLTDYEMEISFTDGSIIQGIDIRPECGESCEPCESCEPWERQEIRLDPPVKHKVIIHNAIKQGSFNTDKTGGWAALLCHGQKEGDRMIPQSDFSYIAPKIKYKEMPGLTYRLDIDNKRFSGDCDGIEAVKQAVYKALATERYKYPIYSWNYGAELENLFGKPISYAVSEIPKRIKDALIRDDRIEN